MGLVAYKNGHENDSRRIQIYTLDRICRLDGRESRDFRMDSNFESFQGEVSFWR